MADQYNSAHTGAEIDQAVADVQNNKAAWSSKPQPSATTPKAPGTASAGSESAYARGDHVHPRELPAVTTSDNGKFLRVVMVHGRLRRSQTRMEVASDG